MLITPLGTRIIVRFGRKPFWMPTAPSKLFRISEHSFYTPKEVEQIRRLMNDYHDQEFTISEYLKTEFYIPASKSGGLQPEFLEKERLLNEEILAENDRLNSEVGASREAHMANVYSELKELLIDTKLRKEDAIITEVQSIDNFIRERGRDTNSFVTEENFEEAITHAMDNPQSYEFCVDRSGKMIKQQTK